MNLSRWNHQFLPSLADQTFPTGWHWVRLWRLSLRRLASLHHACLVSFQAFRRRDEIQGTAIIIVFIRHWDCWQSIWASRQLRLINEWMIDWLFWLYRSEQPRFDSQSACCCSPSRPIDFACSFSEYGHRSRPVHGLARPSRIGWGKILDPIGISRPDSAYMAIRWRFLKVSCQDHLQSNDWMLFQDPMSCQLAELGAFEACCPNPNPITWYSS